MVSTVILEKLLAAVGEGEGKLVILHCLLLQVSYYCDDMTHSFSIRMNYARAAPV